MNTSRGKATTRKATNKTVQTVQSPKEFITSIEHPTRRADAEYLLPWFESVTKMPAVMWGASIVGYGKYHYVYDSGRSGDSLITGFSPRKSALSIYIMPGYTNLDAYLERLGKHKVGKSCLYVNKLADIDMKVLEEIVLYGVSTVKQRYETWNS